MQKQDRGTNESYLIRVYRRDKSGIAGLVEIIGEDKTEPFRDAGELLAIMGMGIGLPDKGESSTGRLLNRQK